jgi:polysaccharide pyruvyl transferase WcaK-like protein
VIYLICHSGFLNYGDELIAGAWIVFLARKYPDKQIYVDTCYPGVSSLLHGTFSNVVYTDTLWKLARSCLHQGLDYVLDLDFLKSPGPDIEFGIDHFKGAEVVHFVGGGYITEYHYPNYAILLLASQLKAKCGFTLLATGLGIEPLSREHRTILQGIFDHFDNVDLRDPESYHTVQAGTRRPRVTLSPDDAFLSERISASSPEGYGKLVLIAHRDEVSNLVFPFLLNLIKSCPLSKNGVTISVLDKRADLSLARQVARAFSDRSESGGIPNRLKI